MLLRGLAGAGYTRLAHEIGMNHHANIVKVFEETRTLWENYAPEKAAKGNVAAPEFVGWTGLPPVAVLFEQVFGLGPDVRSNTLEWTVRLLERHGVRRYPFGKDGWVDLECAARTSAAEKPRVTARSSVPLSLELVWDGGREMIRL